MSVRDARTGVEELLAVRVRQILSWIPEDPPVHFGNPVPTTEATFASTSDRMTHAERIQHRTNESSGDSAEIESDERP
jgi:hypothetical protein